MCIFCFVLRSLCFFPCINNNNNNKCSKCTTVAVLALRDTKTVNAYCSYCTQILLLSTWITQVNEKCQDE